MKPVDGPSLLAARHRPLSTGFSAAAQESLPLTATGCYHGSHEKDGAPPWAIDVLDCSRRNA